jgi:hypothetical protein
METRRIRRLERRRAHRIAWLAVSVAVLCVAIGMSLPHSTTASVLLFVAAGGCLVIVVMRDEARAPLHGLHRVVRLPFAAALAATAASFWSRVTGSLRAVLGRRMQPTPILLDEPDDEAEAWWGRDATAPLPLLTSIPGLEPQPPELVPEAEVEVLPAPVLAAPMHSARVPADDAGVKVRVKQLWFGTRTHVEGLARNAKNVRKAKRSGGGEFNAST